jgi:hypothetical protein
VSDHAFVTNAKASWERVLALQDNPGMDGHALTVAAALWASLNADKLLKIAAASGRATRGDAS